ncbi:MAG: hypothetical protein OER80_05750 [Gammaproteobacteria bacterium]|nr:hypothetical protein [Gammaproteobacteria bacterium]
MNKILAMVSAALCLSVAVEISADTIQNFENGGTPFATHHVEEAGSSGTTGPCPETPFRTDSSCGC